MDRDSWNTPPQLAADIRATFVYATGDGIDLDPCSNPTSMVDAKRAIMLPDDGLAADWSGNVFVNPPYSKPGPWLKRCAEHAEDGGNAIALVNVATETNYWHEWVWPHAAAISFTRGRLAFYRNGEPAKGNRYAQALILYSECDKMLDYFRMIPLKSYTVLL